MITYRKIKMVIPQITPRVTSLHDHLLPAHRSTRKREFITSAAPRSLRLTRQLNSSPTVTNGVVDGPRGLVATHEGGAAGVARALGRAPVVERLVALAARPDHLPAVRLLRPRAARLAAVPVPCRLSGPGSPLRRCQVSR